MADYAPFTIAALLVDALVRLGVTQWFVSPGSRSAPLTVAIAQRSDVTPRVIYDERSAGYVALGCAQQTGVPAALVCTSGTAAANYLPAIAEAFYQSIPLIVVTADRPPEWIDQQDNQAIRQTRLYGDHVLGAWTTPLDDGAAITQWHVRRIVTDAFATATRARRGPVHINVPLREPLYAPSATDFAAQLRNLPSPARTVTVDATLPDATWGELLSTWRSARRKLIVAGLHAPSPALSAALDDLTQDRSVVVIGDVTANLHATRAAVAAWEVALADGDVTSSSALQPDLVLSWGGPVTSRPLRALLRAGRPAHFWRVGPELPAPDTFQANTLALPMPAESFLIELARRACSDSGPTADYAQSWQTQAEHAAARLAACLDAAPFGEWVAMRTVLAALPADSRLQIGNSMPIRYANLLADVLPRALARVDANRGTSGIDGAVSTAVGAAMAFPSLCTLIVGDLGFFYDRNGLWHDSVPENLRIIVLNNHGGGIFDIIDGPEALPVDLRSRYFLTPHNVSARRTCEDFAIDYRHAGSLQSLNEALSDFFAPSTAPRLIEIETDMAGNGALYKAWKAGKPSG